LMTRIAAPGARCFLYCFYAPKERLPRMSFTGPSRIAPAIEPGEMERLFGAAWDIEHLTEFDSERREAVFLMTRKAGAA
jgi:hypothetical protein